MAPKAGACVFVLILVCAAVAEPADVKRGNKADIKNIARRLMMKCKEEGHPVPDRKLLKEIFSNSDLPMKDGNPDQPNTVLSAFVHALTSVNKDTNKDSKIQLPISDKMTDMMWDSSNLSDMIKLMRNSSEPLACYKKALLASLSWETLTTQDESKIDSDDYDTLVGAAKPVLQEYPSAARNLPAKVQGQHMKEMMNLLDRGHDYMSESERTGVGKWKIKQMGQRNSCIKEPPTDSATQQEPCKPSTTWLDLEALKMMGPYLSQLSPDDVDSSPKEKLCEFFRSGHFKALNRTNMKPSLCKKFLQKIQECFRENEFPENVDKLGPLACCYYKAPDLTPALSKELLSELDDCDNPNIIMLKKHIVNSLVSTSISVQVVRDLGSSVSLLPPKKLSEIPRSELKEVLKNLKPSIKWTHRQERSVVRKLLGDKKCNEVSSEEVMDLQLFAGGLPSCVLKHVKPQDILNNPKALKNICDRMKKGQSKTLIQQLQKKEPLSELVQKLPGPCLHFVSLDKLSKADMSLDQVEGKTLTLPQATYLARKLIDPQKLLVRKLAPIIHGITCKMIEKFANSTIQDMTQDINTCQRLSKVQAGCFARKYFLTLEKDRDDYFKTISEDELDAIPTVILVHLPPEKVMALPDTMCPVFFEKMEKASLSSLPLRALSRRALTKRALLCLAKGADLSGLTSEDVLSLGPLLCELSASQLRRMDPNVLNSSLQAMASCQNIPPRHRADLILLVYQIFGEPSNWSAKTMESMGTLTLMDDDTISALPNKAWLKDDLYFLKPRLARVSDALKKKIFDLATNATNAARKKRAATGNGSDNTGTDSSSGRILTQESFDSLIEELGSSNVYWTPTQLEKMSKDTFKANVETLGVIQNYSEDQLAVLSRKAVEAFGPLSQMTESDVLQLGCILQGFSNSDLEKLQISLDTLEEIADCPWTEPQMKSVWTSVAKYDNQTVQEWGAAEIVAMNKFISGLSVSETEQINLDAFKDAVNSMHGIQFSLSAAQMLKRRAVAAFGPLTTWTEAQVSELGDIIAGLDGAELASLDATVFPFISETSIPLIPPDNLAALSVDQLEALGPDNAEKVTSQQQAVLKDDQLAALEKALTGSRNQTVPSGAPSLSVEGILAFMKPLLLLLMGVLLL